MRRGLETTINGQVSEGRIFPEIYVPLPQGRRFGGELVIRTTGEPLAILPGLRAAVYAVCRTSRCATCGRSRTWCRAPPRSAA